MKGLLLFSIATVFSLLAQAQTITTIAGCGIGDDSMATKAELFYPHNIAVDTFGNVYIAEANNFRVRKVSSSGVITTFAGTGRSGYSGDGGPATSATLNNPSGIAVDKSGNVYVADQGNNRIREINSSGTISTFAGDGSAGYSGDGSAAIAAKLNQPNGIALDTSGNLYIADAGNNRIRKVNTSGIITTVAGNGTGGYMGDGSPATAAEINLPDDVTADNKGNIYIADLSNNRIRRVNAVGIITTTAGNGSYGYSGDGSPATAAEISNVNGITADTSGNVYFSDGHNSRIRKIVTATGIITSIAGKGIAGFWGDGGLADSAKFCQPAGLAIDRQGNLFIADNWNNRVRELTTTGTITTFAGQSGLFEDGTACNLAELSTPSNIAVDASGNVYVADYFNNRIRVVGASGIITTVAGNGISGTGASYSGDNGPADSAQIFYPAAVAVDITGNIYIADYYNNRIRKVNTSGIITTIAGNGTASFSGDGGMATAAEISSPDGVAVDNSGNVYIADMGNYRIRKVNTSGIISTVAGNGTSGATGDSGPAISAEINPADVGVDAPGNLYIPDAANSRIRKVDITGTITTIAGNGTYGYSGDGGLAISAKIGGPTSVKVDGAGNIYFSDFWNNRIRMVDTSGNINTIAGNGTEGFSGDGGIATAAELNGPSGVAIDVAGNLYIADGYNYRIRKVTGILSVSSISNTTSWNVTVYPNPASNELTILATVKITNVTISNVLGQTVYNNQYNSESVQVNIADLSNGIYFVKINGTEARKFVKR